MPVSPEVELVALAHDWDRAMVRNDVAAIGRFMADDWTIIGADGGVSDKSGFLALVASGSLSHDVMHSESIAVRVYGATAILTAYGVSGGLYQGRAFHDREISSNVFVRKGEHWRCVLTHLSRLAPTNARSEET